MELPRSKNSDKFEEVKTHVNRVMGLMERLNESAGPTYEILRAIQSALVLSGQIDECKNIEKEAGRLMDYIVECLEMTKILSDDLMEVIANESAGRLELATYLLTPKENEK